MIEIDDDGRRSALVDTPTSRLIGNTALIAPTARGLVTIIGEPGVGKSTALADLARRDCGAAMIVMSPASNSFVAVLEMIFGAFGLYAAGGNQRTLHNSICGALPELVESGRYLIVDEAQVLTGALLYQLIHYHKEYGLPLVLAGNRETLKRTRATESAVAQVSTHVIETLNVGTLMPADIDAYAAGYNVEFSAGRPEAYELLRQFGRGRTPRKLCQVLAEASRRTEAGPTTHATLHGVINPTGVKPRRPTHLRTV